MPNVVMTVPNPFKAQSERLVDFVPKSGVRLKDQTVGPGTIVFETSIPESQDLQRQVRRPLSGIAVKPNTHAFIQVVDSKGNAVKVFNQLGSTHASISPKKAVNPKDYSSPQDDYWTDWLLQSVVEQRAEKSQIVETFGDPILYVFGERPRFLQFTGQLINSMDFNWRAEFWENWERYFRATRLVEKGHLMFIGFDDILISGYPLNAAAMQQAQPNQHVVQFNFNFFVTNYMNTYMMDVGSIQGTRLALPPKGAAKIARTSEYVAQTGFADSSLDLARVKDGPLSKVIGGQNLRFREYFQKQFGYQLEFYGIQNPLFDPQLRHKRGAKSAIDYIITHMNKLALQQAYRGVDELAKITPGGAAGLTFWFGFVGHLYQQMAVNAVQGLRTSQQRNRWVELVDVMATAGNPFAVASYLGYASKAALTTTLRTGTKSLELSNLRYDPQLGLVSKKQHPSYGAQISYKDDPTSIGESAAYYNSLQSDEDIGRNSAYPGMSFDSVGDETAEAGQFEKDPTVSTDSLQVDEFSATEQQAVQNEEQRAVQVQNDELDSNHGGAVVLDSPSDIEDDGVEED